jgi:hypothetical protein
MYGIPSSFDMNYIEGEGTPMPPPSVALDRPLPQRPRLLIFITTYTTSRFFSATLLVQLFLAIAHCCFSTVPFDKFPG